MFQIGFWELIVVFVVALIFIKPEQMPALARFFGTVLKRAKRIVFDFKNELNY